VDRNRDDTTVEQDEHVEDLDVDPADTENVKGGAASSLVRKDEPGVEAQHNETLLRA
jgi:hypothetical protein